MKILFYDDNPDFGGHQVMALHGVEALAADPAHEIVFMLNPANRMLAERLKLIPRCRTEHSPLISKPLQGLRIRFNATAIRRIAEQISSLSPDRVVCIQGDIEQSSYALAAARKAGIDCISYIALPHTMSTMGAKLGQIRDRFNHHLLNLPTRFIAISESMAGLLESRGCNRPITIVPNGITAPNALPPPGTHPVAILGMLGRIEFKQKQQDFMLETFSNAPAEFADCCLLIGGDGPDRLELEQRVAESSRRTDIELIPWQENPKDFFTSIDMLVIPSRYEGVPLVMLEALVRNIPVIASNRDGMRDLLPPEWTFEAGNANALLQTFSHVRDTWMEKIGPLQQKVLTEHTLDHFKECFAAAVLS